MPVVAPSRSDALTVVWALLLAGALAVELTLHGDGGARTDLAMIAALLGVGSVAHASQAAVREGRAHLDAGIAVALCALVVAGPLVAFIVLLVPEIVDRARQGTLRRQGTVTNAAAYACATLAGALLLDAQPAGSFSAVLAAGPLVASVNFLVGPFLLTAVGHRRAVREAFAPFREAAFAQLVMVVVAALTAELTQAFGLVALLAFCAAVPAPQLALGALARARPANELDHRAATRLYSSALAEELRLDRHARRVLAATLGLVLPEPPQVGMGERVRHEAALARLHLEERWDGAGHPAGLARTSTPAAARLLAVALAWAELTAAGGPELSHAEARLALAAQAATRFDPHVVDAVGAIVEAEGALSAEPRAQPRLHKLLLPHAVRRRLLRSLAAS